MTCHFACTLFIFISYKKNMLTLALLTCYLQKLYCVAVSEGEIQGWGLKKQLKVIKVMHQYSHTKGLSGPVCANREVLCGRPSRPRGLPQSAKHVARFPAGACLECLGRSGREVEVRRAKTAAWPLQCSHCTQPQPRPVCPDGSQSRPWSSLTLKYTWQ